MNQLKNNEEKYLIQREYSNAERNREAVRFGRLFCYAVLPLVFLAAVTEAFITPAIIALVA